MKIRILTGLSSAFLGACLMTLASASIAQIAGDDDLRAAQSLMPSAALTPEQVVQIQLEALRLNDSQNRGIEVAFRFASPDNKQHTGPLPRFISMLHERPYSLMLGYENVAYDPMEIVEDYARQRVTLISAGVIVAYEFYLSRQTSGDCLGCWLTDAVVAKPPTGLQVQS